MAIKKKVKKLTPEEELQLKFNNMVKDYLKENLTVNVCCSSHNINVSIRLEDEEITSATDTLPRINVRYGDEL